MDSQVFVKAETRNHKGFFVKQGAYKLKILMNRVGL